MKELKDLSQEEVHAVAALGAALDELTAAQTAEQAAQERRNEQLAALRRLGWSIQDVADVSGLSTSFVHKTTKEVPV